MSGLPATPCPGKHKDAVDQYKELAALSPKDPEVFKNLYELSEKNGNAAEAAQYLRTYVTLKPTDAAAQKDLGDLLYDKKDMPGALAAYRAAVRIDPAIKGVYKRYIELLGAGAEPAEFTTALNGAIAAGEADATAYASLGTLYLKQGFCRRPSTCSRSRSSLTRATRWC